MSTGGESPYTHLNLAEVEDAAPGNGFGERWEARVARQDLGAERTGLTHFRLRPGKRSPFSHRHREAEEIYVVLSGDGLVKLGDEIRAVRPRGVSLNEIRPGPLHDPHRDPGGRRVGQPGDLGRRVTGEKYGAARAS